MNLFDPTSPLLAIYVVWHPGFLDGPRIAEGLRRHFRRELYENVAGGTGLSVIFRSTPAPNQSVPIAIDVGEAQTTAVVVLVDASLATDEPWGQYLADLAAQAAARGLAARVFPVSIEQGVLGQLRFAEQAIRWDRWVGDPDSRQRQLASDFTYELCRMLRHHLEHLKRPEEDESDLSRYLRKVQIFLSHSKHDEKGERTAVELRDRIQASQGLTSFFDVHDIPAGLRFHHVLLEQVRVSAMVAVYTDTYSSREWCRREIIEAKRHNVPLVVANCLSDLDERGFPYMGNVPMVRLEEGDAARVNLLISRLMDEVLKDFLWRCRTATFAGEAYPSVTFIPRPPELITLAGLSSNPGQQRPVIVYPDPPLSSEEERLFASVAPQVQLRSFAEWLSGAIR